MATWVSFDMETGEFSSDSKPHATPKPHRGICDGCLSHPATTWYGPRHEGTKYFDSLATECFEISICDVCKTQASQVEAESLLIDGLHSQAFESEGEASGVSNSKRKQYEKSDAWKQLREVVFRRDKHTCGFCLSRPAEAVHHLSYNNYANELLFELVAVCARCHLRYHDIKNDYWGRMSRRDRQIDYRKKFPSLSAEDWRLSNQTNNTAPSRKADLPAFPNKYFEKEFLNLDADLWRCECQQIALFNSGMQGRKYRLERACKQCGDFHRFSVFRKMPKCELISALDRQLEFTVSRLDALARNSFAVFQWPTAIQQSIEKDWPCQCRRVKAVFRRDSTQNKYYGSQCLQCGIFRDATDTSPVRKARAAEYDASVAMRFRQKKYRRHLDLMIAQKLDEIVDQKVVEATKWFNSKIASVNANLDLVPGARCCRCGDVEPLHVWFAVIPKYFAYEYFNCLDLARFCDKCYQQSVRDFAERWNPYAAVVVPLNAKPTISDKQSMLF